MKINHKINIDNKNELYYNKTNIEIFTIKEYNLYKEKYEEILLNDNEEQYHLVEVNNPHDKICRKALENKKDAVKIINRVLDEGEKITENEIEKYKSSYIEELRNSESDVVYKLKNENVFFLIEHQTKIDYQMPYRMLKYQLNIIESVNFGKTYMKKEEQYSLVIPIVLYTGNQKWNAKLDLKNAQYKWKKYKVNEISRYNILDINEISDIELLEEKSIISKIMLIEKSKTEDELCENLNKIYFCINKDRKTYSKEEKKFLFKVVQILTLNKVGKEKTKNILKNLNLGGEEDMLAVFDVLQKTNQEMLNKGRIEGKIDDLKNMIKEKLPIDLISKITGFSEEQIKQYANKKQN